MKLIQLTQGAVALVDDDDFDMLSQFSWSLAKRRRASTDYAQARVLGKCTLMHRLLVNPGSGILVDHKDGNGLNNQRDNLRETNKSGNEGNTNKRATNTSGYKGVFWDKTRGKWLAQIHTAAGNIHLGRHATREEAALAYNKGAMAHFGEFARLNVVPGLPAPAR